MSQQRQKAGLQLLSSKINEHFGTAITAEQLQAQGWSSWQRPGNRNNYFQNDKLSPSPLINSPSVIRVIEKAAELGQEQDVLAMLGGHAHQVLQRDVGQAAAPTAAAADDDDNDDDDDDDVGDHEPGVLLYKSLRNQDQQRLESNKWHQQLDDAAQQDSTAQKDQGHHRQQQQAAEDQCDAAAEHDTPALHKQGIPSTDNSNYSLPSHLVWLPVEREQQGIATIADWLAKSVPKHSSRASFAAAHLRQLGMRVVGAEDRGPGARNYVWWPRVLPERAVKMHSFRHGAELLLAREDCRRALGITAADDVSPIAATAAAATAAKPRSSSWANTAAAVTVAAAAHQRTSSSNEPPTKRSKASADAAATPAAAAAACGDGQTWQPDANADAETVGLVGSAGGADSKAAGALEQLLAALKPLKPLVIWPPAAYSALPLELRTGLPAAIANFIEAADDHITQLQRRRAVLLLQAGSRQGQVRHYSLRQQVGGSSSSVSVASESVLQAVDAAVGWLQGEEQQLLLQRARQALQLQQQAQDRQVLPPTRGSKGLQRLQQAQGSCVAGGSTGVTTDDAPAEAAAAAGDSSGVRGQSAEAESVAPSAVEQHGPSIGLISDLHGEDVVAVREKCQQLEAELALLQQREAQLALAAGAEQHW